LKRYQGKPNNRNKNKNKWYSPTLKQLKKELKYYGKLLCTAPHEQRIRDKYHTMLKNYRKKCKKEQRNYKIKILNMMDRLQTTNPKGYWKLVEELTDKHKTKTDIEVEKLHKHYHHLNSTININNMVEK
jgi:hypothetical protein